MWNNASRPVFDSSEAKQRNIPSYDSLLCLGFDFMHCTMNILFYVTNISIACLSYRGMQKYLLE